ncbi:hypothetical protein [Kitasatospora sp. NBC_01266]|uniref:hypothetical protein n=1 Tax=Kitasatospora sp. NBC_01266 TaxID=2903572 RepID=UPI002E325368|nr:hypothetical protein [Kitasatospora sp. NBC_01266]
MAGQHERDSRSEQDQQPAAPTAAKPGPAAPAKKTKLVFADPLSRQTADDTDTGWGESGASRGLDWYLSQRPPHHGG